MANKQYTEKEIQEEILKYELEKEELIEDIEEDID